MTLNSRLVPHGAALETRGLWDGGSEQVTQPTQSCCSSEVERRLPRRRSGAVQGCIISLDPRDAVTVLANWSRTEASPGAAERRRSRSALGRLLSTQGRIGGQRQAAQTGSLEGTGPSPAGIASWPQEGEPGTDV